MTDRDRIVSRVKKLLALDATNATQGEVENAVAMAARLMAEHAIEQDDLEAGGEAEGPTMARDESPLRGKVSTWESTLAVAVKEAVPGVSNFVTSKYGRTFDGSGQMKRMAFVVWFGPEDLVEIARRLYDDTRHVIATMAVGKYGGVYRGEGRSYCEGFATALVRKVRGTQQEHGLVKRTTAIVRKAERDNRQWLAETHGVRLKSRSGGGGGRHHGNAFGDGQRDGSRHGFAAGKPRGGRSMSGGRKSLPA